MTLNNGRVIVVDNGYVYRRAIMAFRNNYSQTAVTIWLAIMLSYVKQLKITSEDLVLIAEDYSTWRRTYYPRYKGQRKEKRESVEEPEWWNEVFKEFRDAVPVLEKCFPWYFLKMWLMEADDWGAAACSFYKDKEIICISSDSDWEQLFVYPNVKIFSIITKKFKPRVDGYSVLLNKMTNGDKKDNVVIEEETKMEKENREKILSLIKLPEEIERPLHYELSNLPVKSYDLSLIPNPTMRARAKKLYLNKV